MSVETINETVIDTTSSFKFRPAAGFLILWMALTLISYGAGSVFMDYRVRRLDAGIDEAEAMLRFNHLTTFRKLEASLVAGCVDAALQHTRRQIDEEMAMLAGFQKERPDSWVHGYMARSDPELSGRLKAFKRSYPDSWIAPRCKGEAANASSPDRQAFPASKTANR